MHLHNTITKHMDTVVPITTKKIGNKKANQWITSGLKISLEKSNKLLYGATKKTNKNKSEYIQCKIVLDRIIREAKNMT